MVIWKFPLKLVKKQTLEMPKNAKILHGETQADVPCIWALCDPDAQKENRTFVLCGTGSTIDNVPGPYLGTFLLQEGTFVLHAFEEEKQEKQ